MSLGSTLFQVVRREPTLVCYWRLTEAAGSSFAIDYGARYNLNGLINGSPMPSPALIQADTTAGSYAFGGAGVNVQVPDISALHVTGDISIEALVLPYSAGQTKTLVGKMNAAGTVANPYALSLSSGKPRLALGNGTTQTTVTATTATPLTGIPSHVVTTSFRGLMTAYLSGLSVGTATLGAQAVTDGAQPLYIGSIASATGFSGLIGEVALYSGALSATRVLRHFNILQQVLPDPGHFRAVDRPTYA